MIVVIQCAARKHPDAGYLRRRDGRRVMIVADTGAVPAAATHAYARPDDICDSGKSWRTRLREYSADPGGNPLGLLPAWQLYRDRTSGLLAEHCGLDRLYILSAGWGLVPADFLTAVYDITFTAGAGKYKRRRKNDRYNDLQLLQSDTVEPVVFFGGRNYLSLFLKLTANKVNHRMVFFAGSEPDAPGCRLHRFGKPFTNWQYACARAYVEGKLI